MGNYYFLGAFLPPLKFGERPSMGFGEVMRLLRMNLRPSDWGRVIVLRHWWDLHNIRALYAGQPVDTRGNLSESALEQALLMGEHFPPYIKETLDRYEKPKDKAAHFAQLLSRFLCHEGMREGFLGRYFQWERHVRLVLTALQSRVWGRDLVRELEFEDPHDGFVVHILRERTGASYEPPREFVGLKEAYVACGRDPWQQAMSVAQWKFHAVQRLVATPYFSMDALLCYGVRLALLEDLAVLDGGAGRAVLEAFVG